MKTALVLGITGNFGLQMALALKEQGWRIKALLRDASKAPSWLEQENQFIGDANEVEKVREAAKGVELIVCGLNPSYTRWHTEALALLEPSIVVAQTLGIRLLFPGNVYNFAPTVSLIDESQTMNPLTEKGVIRVAIEARLRKATEHGAKVTIVRAGDFLGPNANETWLDLLYKQKNGKAKMTFPHDEHHVHYWTYLPDLCANTALLMERPQADFEVFHDPGLALRRSDWQSAFENIGQIFTAGNFAWWAVKLASPFVPLLREVLKMKYLWLQPVIMDGSKMKLALGDQLVASDLTTVLSQITQTN